MESMKEVVNEEDDSEKIMQNRLSMLLKRHEKLLVAVLMVIAFTRIFVFSAAFPFFNNVDERGHFDTVVKYARGFMPCIDCDYYDKETALIVASLATPEYFSTQKIYERTPFNPNVYGYVMAKKNHEAFSPPLYYSIAGLWYNLGKAVGLKSETQIYFVKFLNIPAYIVLMLFSYLTCKKAEPKNLCISMGVLLLLAFFPNDIFYSVNSDIFSPVFFAVGLFIILEIFDNNKPIWIYALGGLMASGMILSKLSNLPIILLFGIVVFLLIFKRKENSKIYSNTHLGIMCLAFIVPVAIWMGINRYYLGDFTGTSQKILHLGFKPKQLSELFNHPIFSFQGMTDFMSQLVVTFWRGEFVWRGQVLTTNFADKFYMTATMIFFMYGVFVIVKNYYSENSRYNSFYVMCILAIVAYIIYLVFLSIIYNYDNAIVPSNDFPYFAAGRLISATMVPFFMVFIKGVEGIALRLGKYVDPLIIVLLLVSYITYSEIQTTISAGVFSSPYNYFSFAISQ